MRQRLILPPSYRDAVVATRPTYYWRLNETSGTVARDQMGVLNGTYNGTVNYQGGSGPPGVSDAAAIKLPGSGNTQYVGCGSPTLSQTGYSLMVWFNSLGINDDRQYIGRWTGAGGHMFWSNTGASTGKITLIHTATAGNWLVTNAPSQGVWHCLIGTWDGANMFVYLDGLQIGTRAMVTAPGSPAETFRIGSYSTLTVFLGSLSEGAYWTRALTAADAANLNTLGR